MAVYVEVHSLYAYFLESFYYKWVLSFVRTASASVQMIVFFLKNDPFLAVMCLCCCAWAFSSCSKWQLPLIVVHGPLPAVASLVAEHRLSAHWPQ